MRIPSEGPVVVSACLAGVPCTHDAEAKTRAWAVGLVAQGRAVPVCPEVLGGLAVPRPPAEILGGDGETVLDGRARVVDSLGNDVTAAFLDGARAAATEASRAGAEFAVLKARSPSCGVGRIYDGSFSRHFRNGDGVTTALLRSHGVTVVSDEEIVE